jgi:hypothetical protein
MKTYIEQLKSKYDDPAKAYKYYALSKTLLHHMVVSETAPQEIKDILDIQKILNDYCENFIEQDTPKELHEFFGFSDKEQLKDYIFTDQNFEKLHFLEITYEFRDSVLDGEYQNDLIKQSRNATWSKLEELIIKENNNNFKIEGPVKINEQLGKIVEDFGLISISVGSVKIEDQLIEKTYNSLEQLSVVLDCNKKHVGLNKLNICLDGNNEIDLFSGYVERFKSKHFKLYITSSVMDNILAHEWFHFLDMVTAEHNYRHIYGEDIHKYRLYESRISQSFKNLYEKAASQNNATINNSKEKISSNIDNIIDKHSALNTLNNADELKKFIKTEIIEKKFSEQTFRDKDLIEEIQKFQINKNNGLVPYILSEIDMLPFRNPFTISAFFYYAYCFDKHMKNADLLGKDDSYSTKIEEATARIFESYVDLRLQEKNIKNIISRPNDNFYTPYKGELKSYVDDFEVILNGMKKNFNLIYPLSEKDIAFEKIFKIRNEKKVILNTKNRIN